jgi:hypothetical protein
LQDNPEITTLEGLQGLERVDGIYIENAPIVSLDGLRGLTSTRSLAIVTVPALTNIDGLSGVTDFEELTLSDARVLTDLDGIGNATRIGFLGLSSLSIASLGTLPNLTSVSGVQLTSLPNLAELDAFAKLSSPPAIVWLYDLPSLTSLRGLSSLRRTDSFDLHGTGVTALTGLELLERGGSSVRIENNPVLTSLRALTSLSGLEFLAVTDNAMLPTCEAEWLVARANPVFSNVFGNDDGGTCP